MPLMLDYEGHLTFKLHTGEGEIGGEIWTNDLLTFYCGRITYRNNKADYLVLAVNM